MEEHHFEELLAEGESSLHVMVEIGEIDIRPHKSQSVIVDAKTEGMDVSVHRKENTVFVRVDRADAYEGLTEKLGRLLKDGQPRAVVNVRVPASCQVRAKTVTGRLRVSGINAPTTTRVVTGNTQLDHLGGSISAKTVTGSVHYRGPLTKEHHRFEATTGKVHLEFTEMPDARLDARTTTGAVHCNMPIEAKVERRHLTGDRLRGTLGTGKGDIKARVVTGSLSLECV